MEDSFLNRNDSKQTRALIINFFQAIPCILHLKNPVGEGILKMLLIEALKIRDGEPSASIDEYSNTFESIINTEILGSNYAPSQW